jgi:hypothetical protein
MNTEWIRTNIHIDVATENIYVAADTVGHVREYNDCGAYTQFWYRNNQLAEVFVYDDEYSHYVPTEQERIDWMLKVMKS